MLRISAAVEQEVRRSEAILESLRLGVLNLSAYALSIHDQIEAACMKPVKHGSIVVALSRLQPVIQASSSLRPTVHIDDMSVKSPLADITYERTDESLAASKRLQQERSRGANDFFTLTEGVHEITIICAQKDVEMVKRVMGDTPKAFFTELTGISLRFDPAYIDVPNAIYAILGALAIESINVLEIVSTYAELTVIVRDEDATRSIARLRTV